MSHGEANPSALLASPLRGGDPAEDSSGSAAAAAAAHAATSLRRRFLGGVFLLGIVVFLWVFSSVLTQFLYDNPDVNYKKPTALTTLSTATAAIFVLPELLRNGGCLKRAASRESLSAGRVDLLTVFLISLNWFLCQWTFNVSLGHTALATNTLLSSTSVVWSYVFTVLVGFRKCSLFGPVCILLALSGISLAVFGPETRVDPTAPVDDLFGTALALGSAAMYGAFSNMLAMRVKPGQMTLVWGFVGVSSVVIGAILMLLGHITGLETFEVPSRKALSIMLLNGFVGTSISDYIWAQGVLLTTPLVANISLNMTIPLSMIVDALVLRQHTFSWTSPLGGVLVFSGVVVAALDEVTSDKSSLDSDSTLTEMQQSSGGEEPSWQQM